MELSEVAEKFPQIECLLFPSSDSAGILALLKHLREIFGRTEIREEDRLRVASLRAANEMHTDVSEAHSDEFIARLQAKLTFEEGEAASGRAFELVNKTNQFNLNGLRFTEAEWHVRFGRSGSFLTTVSYEDRFGPLGRIAVVGGCCQGNHCLVDIFVLSCRAFSRHIEFQILRRLFEKSGAESVLFMFKPTERNGPIQAYLSQFGSLENTAAGGLEVSSEAFVKACPKLHHEVIEKWTM